MASKVYWADLRADYRENLPQKLTRLMKTAGMGQIDFEDKFAAIIPNVGMFASFDPVALDMACVDAVNAQPPLPGAAAAGDCGHDHFHHLHPETDWMSCLEHAEKLGMGTREYELIKI